MTNDTQRTADRDNGDEQAPVTRESSRGGRHPSPEVNDQPDQHGGKAAEGSDSRGLADLDGNRAAGTGKARAPDEP